jgi:tetratricopeptide (TPR) repeat protein
MNETRLKYLFYFISAILLCVMLITSRDAGVTCDDVLHYNHSVSVYNYFASHGSDKTALDTPVTHLKYYGQSPDNLVTIIIKWFNIDDVYRFRHLASSLAGWMAILVTAFFAVWLTGYRAGILTLILFAVSPVFMGHSQNNLKDIPFALGYIAGTFFTLKFLVSERKISVPLLILLTSAIAFSISIRAGGLLSLCYLFFFFFLYYLIKWLKDKKIDLIEIRSKLLLMAGITVTAWLLSIILWPYALMSPFKNILDSYKVMAHYPDTFRQIFEGKVEWSDFMPWYYLPKSMAITIPLVVLAGLILFFAFAGKRSYKDKRLLYGFIIFTILFPVFFVIYEKSNIYSSWRQFLFLYPPVVLLAATGFHYLIEEIKVNNLKWFVLPAFAVLAIHPISYMVRNYSLSYMYYNQLTGGVKGAYGNYETDYYYTGQTEASAWLIDYLKNKKTEGPVKVRATYSVQWQFRNHPEIETSYFRYEERSNYDWDYAIVTNRYISPYQLKNNIWPPANSIHVVNAGKVPVCVVLERKSKDDFKGYTALNEGRYKDAISCFGKVLTANDKDEMIFYNFAAALYNDGRYREADSVLKAGLVLNPDFEPILMYLGNIASVKNKPDEAIIYYERLIKANRKYFEAYVGLSSLLAESDKKKARELLRTCLTMNPRYKPAIVRLAETYRKSDPDIAKKYDELAETIK